MRLAQVGVAAALAGASQAFLLPPTVSSSDSAIDYGLPFGIEEKVEGADLVVPCPGCPIETTGEGFMYWGKAKSFLRLNFSVAHNDQDPDALMLNGVQIYPVNLEAVTKSLMSPLTADQLIEFPDKTLAYSSSQLLGYSLNVKHPMPRGRESQLNLAVVRLEIIKVADKLTTGIPEVELKLVETQSHKLMIAESRVIPPEFLPPTLADKQQECTTLLCRWKAILLGKVNSLKGGCDKNTAHGRPRPAFHGVKGGPNKFGHHRPHGPPGFGHHRRPHHPTVGGFLRGLTMHVLLPIFIGIVFGVVASMLGMVVGHFVVFIWRLFFRRGERGQYAAVKQDESFVDSDNDVKDSQGPPPVYHEVIIVSEKTEGI